MLNFLNRNKDNEVNINISNRNVVRVIFIILISYFFLLGLKKTAYPIKLVIISIFITFAINHPVHKLSHLMPGRLKGNRVLGTAISLIIVLAGLSIFMASIVPPLIKQTDNFIKIAPSLVQDLHNQNSSIGKIINKYHLDSSVNYVSTQLANRVNSVSGKTFSTITDVTSSIFSVVSVLVLTFMMLIEGSRWLKFGHNLLDDRKQKIATRISNEMYDVIKGYVNGQVLMAAIAAVIIVLPLIYLNVSYPIALMVIVFICGLIPMVGHTLGAVIITTVSLFHSPIDAVIVLAYYILYMQIEAYVIQPKIQSSKTNLTPLMVFVSLLIGLSIDGLVGGLMAIPIAGCLKVLIEEYLRTHGYISREETKG
ncbi:MAG: AI-2E family transporter [bacterium]